MHAQASQISNNDMAIHNDREQLLILDGPAAGIGGLMQSLAYGYGGLRILAGMVRFRPTAMENGAVFSLENIKYAGWALTLEVGPEHVTLTAAQMDSMSVRCTYIFLPESDSIDVHVLQARSPPHAFSFICQCTVVALPPYSMKAHNAGAPEPDARPGPLVYVCVGGIASCLNGMAP